MSDVFYTSDLHFGHEKMAELRGFSSVEEHDEDIVSTWNRIITKRDHVWILGDVTGSGEHRDWWDRIRSMNGTKHLVLGNHDAGFSGNREAYKHRHVYTWPTPVTAFESVQDFAIRKVGDTRVMLSHFPYDGDHTREDRYEEFRLRDCGRPLLHGHTHAPGVVSRSSAGSLQIHVGWDAWQRPVSTGEVLDIIRSESY